MDKSLKRAFQFGPFLLDPDERTLRNGDERMDLPPRVFDTLLVLVNHSGRLLEKDQLMRDVWPDATVEENNLTQAIYLLRKVLRDGEGGERYIETVPKRGYRFVARVLELGSPNIVDTGTNATTAAKAEDRAVAPALTGELVTPAQPSRRVSPVLMGAMALLVGLAGLGLLLWKNHARQAKEDSSVARSDRSIAVLPMQNLSGDPSQEYFADGFTEELVTELAQVRSLRVISRTSAMQYKGTKKPLPQIARELHVGLVLEGSVLRSGNRVRVTAQLINALTDTHLWARTYDADVKDVLDLQSQISRAIVDDVRLDLSPEERERLASVPTVDPEAHDLYLKASYQYAQQTPDSLRQSLELYRAALNKEPTYALAYLGVALTENTMQQITAESPAEAVIHEKDALGKALAINPNLGDAHGMLAAITYFQEWDWPRADREFQLALQEGAHGLTEARYASALATRGRFSEAQAHVQSALDLDPLSRSLRVNQFFVLYFQRKYPEARQRLNDVLASNPDFFAGHALLGLVSTLQHDCLEASRQAEWSEKHFPAPVAEFEMAMASFCRGDERQARRYLEAAAASKGPAFASPYQLALGYALLNDKNAALSYLQKSAEAREGQILYLKYEPIFDGIRSDPRYIALQKKVGLDP
jgi:TolB-like protein/DNA-binding winged helix-turn-helix (wHTH) protein/Tfp pilus assembly protein PilF